MFDCVCVVCMLVLGVCMKVMFCVSWIGWVLLCYCFDDLFDGILAECWLCLVKLFVLCVLVDIVV